MKSQKTLLIFSLLLIASLACSLPITVIVGETPTPASEDPTLPVSEASPETPEDGSTVPATPSEGDTPEPAPELALYFIANPEGSYQIYRRAPDGTVNRLTNAPGDVNNYAVNPVDGSLAYVLNNQLFLRRTGEDAFVLVDGGLIDESDGNSVYRNSLGGLAWSPDGTILAYGRDGIHLRTIASGDDRHILANVLQDFGDSGVYPGELYNPEQWSPDGRLLMITISYIEGGRPAVLDPATAVLIPLTGGIVCCDAVWADDTSQIFVASPVLGLIESGLWRFPLPTGERVDLLPTTAADGTYNFAGWPIQLPDGSLNFFYANTISIPEGDVPLTMVNAHPDHMDAIFPLRPERWEIYEALWEPDGDAVILVQPAPGASFAYPRTGPIVRVDAAGSPPEALIPDGFNLQWGP